MILSVNALNTASLGTVLDLWYVGGQHEFSERPFDPYLYSTIQIPKYTTTARMMTDLATHKPLPMYKVGFPDTRQLLEHANPSYTTDDDVPYVQRVAIDEGFYCDSALPTHYAFDIETWRDNVQAIAIYGHGHGAYSAGCNERVNIRFLNDEIQRLNPDILDSYWGSYFDVGKMETRANIHHIDLDWGRHEVSSNGVVDKRPQRPYIYKRNYSRGTKQGCENIVKLNGRLHFDVWKEVVADQTLSGIKDKRLRTVANWFKLSPTTLIDYENMDALSDKELGEACLSHAKSTWELCEMYLHRLYYFAESMGLPLNLLFERTPSHIPNYFYMRELEAQGWISRGSNEERYPQFFVYGRKAYQGAIVRLYHAGDFFDIYKDDFKSMYPTIMAVFNLSPETVELISVEHIACTGFETPEFNGQYLTIYDSKIGRITVKIATTESVTRKYIREWMRQRKVVKSKLLEDPHNPQLESWQYGLKVNLNTIYGYHGMRFSRYGCAPIAAIITAIGRWWLSVAVEYLKVHGCLLIESDTDGIYHKGKDYSADLTQLIRDLIPNHAPYDDSFIKVDGEHFKAGIFYEEKSYILLQDNDEPLFHGSGLKGRQMPAIVDKASMEVAEAIFQKKDISHIIRHYVNLKPFEEDMSNFTMTIELHKDESDYNETTLYRKLIDTAKANGIEIEQGGEIRYVKTKDDFVPYPIPRYVYNLDYKYYHERIATVLARLLGSTMHIGSKTLNKLLQGDTLLSRYLE